MATDLRDIVLNCPPTHSRKDTIRMIDAYREHSPVMFDRWIEVEASIADQPGDVLKPFQIDVIQYLLSACAHSDVMGAVKAWAMMRRELVALLRVAPTTST